MAEHDKNLFEHELFEKFAELDENIKILEIPDVQNIFDRAEEQTKVIPFKKYSRYIAAAAAVVLICVSIPIFSSAASAEFVPQEPAESNKSIFNHTNLSADSADRLAMFNAAVRDSEVDLILAVRGGFGSVHILPGIDYDTMQKRRLPVMGYSDITALHCAMQ